MKEKDKIVQEEKKKQEELDKALDDSKKMLERLEKKISANAKQQQVVEAPGKKEDSIEQKSLKERQEIAQKKFENVASWLKAPPKK